MAEYNRGDVILVPYPLNDRLSSKSRPALIVSEINSREIIIVQLTGHLVKKNEHGSYTLVHWQEAGLLRPSQVLMRMATLPVTIILRKLGKLHEDDIRRVTAALARTLGL